MFLPMVSKASRIPETDIIMTGRASWLEFDIDHCWMNAIHASRCTEEQKNIGFSVDLMERNIERDSILVLSESSVFFLDWNPKEYAYTLNDSLFLSNIISFEVVQSIYSSRLFRMEMKNSKHKYYIITLMDSRAQIRHIEKNNQFFEYLNSYANEAGIEVLIY